jgi:predicted dehydrogenase
MGGYHLGDMVGRLRRGEVNIAAVCDIDDKRLQNASRTAGPQADCYRDYRYVLDRKDIDAVIIATPDHWHAVQTGHAAERGKHVYVEKPACCTVEEGKAMIAAANKATHPYGPYMQTIPTNPFAPAAVGDAGGACGANGANGG